MSANNYDNFFVVFLEKLKPKKIDSENFLTFKAIFFESLNECGKNFDAIQVFFHNRNKKNNKLFTSKESNSLLNKNKGSDFVS